MPFHFLSTTIVTTNTVLHLCQHQHHQVNDHLRLVLAQPEQLGHLHLKGDVATNVVQQLVIG